MASWFFVSSSDLTRRFQDYHYSKLAILVIEKLVLPRFARVGPRESGFHLDQRRWVTYLVEPCHKVTAIGDFHILDDYDISFHQLAHIFIPGSYERGYHLTTKLHIIHFGSLASHHYRHSIPAIHHLG